MADGAGGPGSRVRARFDELQWRFAAVVARLKVWWSLPPRAADGWQRSSQYVPVRDGTRIAIDVYRPTRRGVLLGGRLPVIWSFDRYHRARIDHGRLWTRLDAEYWLKALICRGYVVAVADVRGSGASFGSRAGLIVDEDRWDAYDITEWLAAQPWSNGRIGMCGKSFMGITQYLAASTAPPHLVAIAPERTPFDLYDFAYGGGVFRDDYAREWGRNTAELDQTRPAAPVDDDPDAAIRAAALAEHRRNGDVHAFFSALPLRDSPGPRRDRPYEAQSIGSRCRDVGSSGVAVLQFAGWFDMWTRDAFVWHANLPNPRRLIVGPWAHTHDAGWMFFTERLRWFDYWLKQIENGVMGEPPIRYHTAGVRRGSGWRTAAAWPLPRERRLTWYCDASPDGASRTLARLLPRHGEAADAYVVDYTTTSGRGTRWQNGYGREFGYGDMAANDRKALVYTTDALEEEIEVTGHPTVSLWVSLSTADADVFAYLEDVAPDDSSAYVTEGVLRASHRELANAPYDNLGLPYHASTAAAVAPVPAGTVVELRFDLHPVSRVFRRGRRIRLAITGADAGNACTPSVHPPPVIAVHRDQRYPSCLVLPVIDASAR